MQLQNKYPPSLNSSSSSSLVQLQDVIRKNPPGLTIPCRDFTYCFLFSFELSGFRLMASKVPLSMLIWNPDNSGEGFKTSSTCIRKLQLLNIEHLLLQQCDFFFLQDYYLQISLQIRGGESTKIVNHHQLAWVEVPFSHVRCKRIQLSHSCTMVFHCFQLEINFWLSSLSSAQFRWNCQMLHSSSKAKFQVNRRKLVCITRLIKTKHISGCHFAAPGRQAMWQTR